MFIYFIYAITPVKKNLTKMSNVEQSLTGPKQMPPPEPRAPIHDASEGAKEVTNKHNLQSP